MAKIVTLKDKDNNTVYPQVTVDSFLGQVDDAPSALSEDLVRSGGVYNELSDIKQRLVYDSLAYNMLTPTVVEGKGINSDGSITDKDTINILEYSVDDTSLEYRFSAVASNAKTLYFVWYFDINDDPISHDTRAMDDNQVGTTTTYIDQLLSVPVGTTTIKINQDTGYVDDYELQSLDTSKKIDCNDINRMGEENQRNVSELQYGLFGGQLDAIETTTISGKIIRADGTVRDLDSGTIYSFSVEENKVYCAVNFGSSSENMQNIAFVHYYSGDRWLGYDKRSFHALSPFIQTQLFFFLCPSGCDTIKFWNASSSVPAAYTCEIDSNKSGIESELEGVKEVITEFQTLTPFIIENKGFNSDGTITDKTIVDLWTYTDIDITKPYLFSGRTLPNQTTYMLSYWDSSDNFLGVDLGTYGSATETVLLENYKLVIPNECAIIRVNALKASTDYFSLKRGDEYYDFMEMQQRLDSLSDTANYQMAVTKKGTNIYVRSSFSDEKDIVISFYQSNDGKNMCPYNVYLGVKSLSLSELTSSANLIRNISDSVGAIGVKSFWYLYAQHGWSIPQVTNPSLQLDSSDINAVWKDQEDRRYIVGNIGSTFVWFLPEITLVNGIYKASWSMTDSIRPSSFTHVSGGTHTGTITGTIGFPQIQIQTPTERKFIADNAEITADGTYYCNDFIIRERILGHNPAFVSYYPSFSYGDSLIDWERSFECVGASVTCNTIINARHDFETSDYRGVIPQMPLQKGDYQSYSFIPKVKKQMNGHRLDLPFETNDGLEWVNADRTSSDLYDVNSQPDRCINYLKDDNDDYLIGCAGGGSLLRGLSKNEVRNTYCPVGQNAMSYGGSVDTANKFYPKLLQAAGFSNGIIPSSFIQELSCYYCWFNPNDNIGQVYWYKDGSNYIVYAHCQTAETKIPLNLPAFMEGLVVDSVIEKTAGATLHTNQVVSGRLYVSYDTTDNAANYIVMKLK